jgi:tetratricopeptide (TPR) repeat protein
MTRLRPYLHLPLLLVFLACGGSKAVTEKPRDYEGGEHSSADPRKSNRERVMRMFMEATQARLKGELPKAMQIYEATLREDPKNDASMFELAKLYHQSDRPQEAVAMAKRAVATNGDIIWYRFLLADLSVQNNDLAGATKAYQDIVKQWPDRYEVYFGLAGILAEQKKLPEAKQVFRDLEARFGSNEELVTREYDMLVTAGAYEDARALLEKTIAAHPDQTTYYGMLAEVYEQLGQKEKALETYQKALALDPSDSMTRISLAQYYYDAGDRAEGFKHLREAFADPDLDIDPKMQLLLGFFQMTQSGQDSAQEMMVEQSHELIAVMKKAHPQSGKPYSIEGDFFTREGKHEQARDAFREAVKYEQDKYPIWSALVQLDAQINDYTGLHEDASKAADLFPTQPEFHYYNGFALVQLKRHDEAIESFITGRDLVVDNKQLEAQFWASLGDAYNEVKNYPKSDEAYERVLAIDKDNVPVLNNYAYFLSERGEHLEKAAEMSRRSNDLQPGVATYIDTYAWVLYKQGKYAQAKAEQEKALAAAEKPDGTLVEHYGDILFKLGDVAGALEQWKKAQDLGGASELIGRKVTEGKLVE